MRVFSVSILSACGLAIGLAGAAFAQDTIYGIDNSRNVLGTFTSDDPTTFIDIGATGIATGFVNSLEFDGSGWLWASDGTQLYSVDPATGVATLVGPHNVANGESITDFTWDGSTMWAIGTLCGVQSSLYNIDLGTGLATYICTTDLAGACDVGLTVGADGMVYGHDLVTDTIYSVDVATCVTTTVINIAFDTNFGQGLTAGASTNYHVAFNSTDFQGQLWSFDGAGNHDFLGALGPLQVAAADVEQQMMMLELYADIKPGSCPNPLNRKSKGVLPAALLGTMDFDVMMIDEMTVEVSRADGIGGSVMPLADRFHYEDVATPFDGDPCGCHEEGPDGYMDLTMKFKTQDVVMGLELGDLMPGSEVELVFTGMLVDGTPFMAYDCIVLVPRVMGAMGQ